MKNNNKKSTVGIKVPWVIIIPGTICSMIAHVIAPINGSFYAFTDFKGIGRYKWVGFSNFIGIFSSRIDRAAILNTFRIAIPFVVLVLFFGLVLALILNKNLKSRQYLRAIFFAPVVMIPLSVTQVWKFIFDYNGPLNIIMRKTGLNGYTTNWLGNINTSIYCILFVLLWQNVGYAMVIFNAGLESISDEIYEATSIDGANKWQNFKYVTLPLLAPAITITVTMMSITGLRVFDQVLGLTGGGPANMTHTLASDFYFQAWGNNRYGYGTALSLLLTLLVAVIGVIQVVFLEKRERKMV
jgi:raffinose/stachyose/melibiose transport system permease protein